VARVLRGDEVGLRERFARTRTQVPEIADRSSDDVEAA
jgi:hypothetical protein